MKAYPFVRFERYVPISISGEAVESTWNAWVCPMPNKGDGTVGTRAESARIFKPATRRSTFRRG